MYFALGKGAEWYPYKIIAILRYINLYLFLVGINSYDEMSSPEIFTITLGIVRLKSQKIDIRIPVRELLRLAVADLNQI